MKPRTLWTFQPVAFVMDCSVAPEGYRNRRTKIGVRVDVVEDPSAISRLQILDSANIKASSSYDLLPTAAAGTSR
jgi:hypothetical protein